MQRALGLGWSKVKFIPNKKNNIYEAKMENKGFEYHIKITCEYFPSDTALVGEFDIAYEHRKTALSKDAVGERKSSYRKEKALFKYARDQGSGGENKVVLITKAKQYPKECKNLQKGEALLDNEYVALIPSYSLAKNDFLNKFNLMRRMFPWPTVMMRVFSRDGSRLEEEVIVETYGGEDLIHTARRLSERKQPEIMNYNYDVLLRMLAQVVKEIERVHKLGYVHGDVHPGNFLIKHFYLHSAAVYDLYLKNHFPNDVAKLVCEYYESTPCEWLGLRMIDPGQAIKERTLVPRRKTAWSAPEAKAPYRKGLGPFRPDSESAVFDRSADIYSFGYLIFFLVGQIKKLKSSDLIKRGDNVVFSLHAFQLAFLVDMAERCLVCLTDPKKKFVGWLDRNQVAPRPGTKQLHNELVNEFTRFQVEKNALLFLGALIESGSILSEGVLVVVKDWYKNIAEKKIDVDTLSKKILAGREQFSPMLLSNEFLLARYKQFHQSYYEFLLGPRLSSFLESLTRYAYDRQRIISLRSDLKDMLLNLRKLKVTAIVSSQKFLELTKGRLGFLLTEPECAELNRLNVGFFDVWSAFQEGIVSRDMPVTVRPMSEDGCSVGRLDITAIYETAGFNPLSTPVSTPASGLPGRYQSLESLDSSQRAIEDKPLADRSISMSMLPGLEAEKRRRSSRQLDITYSPGFVRRTRDSLQSIAPLVKSEGKLSFSARPWTREHTTSVVSSEVTPPLLTSSDVSESTPEPVSLSDGEEPTLDISGITLPEGMGQDVLTPEAVSAMLSSSARGASQDPARTMPFKRSS